MKSTKRKNIFEKYGNVNTIIAVICVIVLIINSIFVSDTALNQLSSNKFAAYIINFLAGFEGRLGTYCSMSKSALFHEGQWWRLITHIYFHAGILHMIFNLFALLFIGKIVEKEIGSLPYALLFHFIAVFDAFIICMIFPDSASAGASAGIFGMIGFVVALKLRKLRKHNQLLNKGEFIYIIVFSFLSFVLGLESLITHTVAFVLGLIIGFFYIIRS